MSNAHQAQASPSVVHPPRAFASFESRPFRWLLGSLLTFFLGMQGQVLVRSLLAWDLTHSELALAYVNLVIAIPMVAGAFIGGAIIDRFERRRIVFAAQSLALVNELVVLGLLISGHLTYTHLLVTAFIMGTMFPFLTPTRTAMIFPLVGGRLLGNAMALQAAAQNTARVLGPSIVGMLIPVLGMQGAYGVAISLYIISLAMMLGVPDSSPDNSMKKSLLQDMGQSFVYMGRHRDILLTLLFGLFPMLLALPVFSFLVVFTDEVWKVGETGLGWLTATIGAGGIIGALLVAKLGELIPRTKVMMLSGMLFAIVLAAFSLSPSFLLALFCLLVANIFSNVSQTLNQTIIQILSSENMRGRMSGLIMLSLGLTPLGVLPIAFFAERFGIVNTMVAACGLLLAVTAGFFLFSPVLRSLDQRLQEKQESEH